MDLPDGYRIEEQTLGYVPYEAASLVLYAPSGERIADVESQGFLARRKLKQAAQQHLELGLTPREREQQERSLKRSALESQVNSRLPEGYRVEAAVFGGPEDPEQGLILYGPTGERIDGVGSQSKRAQQRLEEAAQQHAERGLTPLEIQRQEFQAKIQQLNAQLPEGYRIDAVTFGSPEYPEPGFIVYGSDGTRIGDVKGQNDRAEKKALTIASAHQASRPAIAPVTEIAADSPLVQTPAGDHGIDR